MLCYAQQDTILHDMMCNILLLFSTLSCWFVFKFKSFFIVLLAAKRTKSPGTGLASRMKLCS